MPDRILPESWRYDPTLCRLRVHTREFLFRLALTMDDYRRCAVGTSPEEPDFLRSMLYPMNCEVRISDIARCLAEAKAAGVILVKDSERGWYCELCERFCYRRSEVKQPKYGDRIERVDQAELHLGPVEVLPVRKPRREKAADSKQSSTESVATSFPSIARGDSGAVARKDSAQASTGKFSRDVNAFPGDAAWGDFCRLLAFDMVECGAMWVVRWKENRRACIEAMQDFRTMSPGEQAQSNAAKYITKAYGNATRASA